MTRGVVARAQADAIPCMIRRGWLRYARHGARRVLILTGVLVLAVTTPAAGKVGDPLAAFARGPVISQLQLTAAGQQPLPSTSAGGILYRFISDDRMITVDLVVKSGIIAQEVMYLPLDMRRGFQVSMFLQDAVGSIVGAQKGLLAFRAAVNNRRTTFLTWGVYTMRFTPMDRGLLQVLVTR